MNGPILFSGIDSDVAKGWLKRTLGDRQTGPSWSATWGKSRKQGAADGRGMADADTTYHMQMQDDRSSDRSIVDRHHR